MHDNTQHLYNNLDLRKLLIPIIVEQLLSSLMGTADTMMVSNVGSAAISARCFFVTRIGAPFTLFVV